MRPDDVLEPVPDSRMALRIASQLAASGALLGATEGMVVGLRSRLLLTPFERVQLALGASLADAAVAAVAGVVGGLVAQFLLVRSPRISRYQRGYGLGFGLVAAFFLVPMSVEFFRRGEPQDAVGVLLVMSSTTLFGYLAAGFAYRREMIGIAPRLGFRLPALGLSASLCGLAGLLPQMERPPATQAPPGAANLVLITVDTLRRDHVGLYGGPVPTPNMDELGRTGVIFDQAITPLPETAPAHATMLTGMLPAEHEVIQNGRRLTSASFTVTEQLSALGWRTGAFVSAFAVDSSVGLDQGFEVYDDDFAPAFRGLAEVRTGWLFLRALMRLGNPADWPMLLERSAGDTVPRALDWASGLRPEEPMFLWVHLFDVHSPYETHNGKPPEVDHRPILAQEPGYDYQAHEIEALRKQYAEEVAYVDTQIGALISGLRAQGRLQNAAVILTSDHGEGLGEHGVHFTHHGLYEEVLRVPMMMWLSEPGDWEPGVRIPTQVTVGDVANTLLEYTGMPKLGSTHSLPLQVHPEGNQVRSNPVPLMGRTESGWVYGVRSPTLAKYIQSEGGKRDEVYDLNSDPTEQHDISAEQPGAVASGRSTVAALLEHIERNQDTDPGTASMLEALGYTDPSDAPK